MNKAKCVPMLSNGYLSVAVPGTVAGLRVHCQYGRLPWATVVAPPSVLPKMVLLYQSTLGSPATQESYFEFSSYPSSVHRNGTMYAPGDRLVQRDGTDFKSHC